MDIREAATCALVELEVLYSARSHEDLVRIRSRRELAYERVPIPDLIIASAAELAGLIVLHYDKHYDIIAELTGQPVEWVVPRGTAG